MRKLLWTSSFVRAHKRMTRRHPDLRARVAETLTRLAEDPFHLLLHSHKLRGDLADRWACTVDYETRLIFRFVEDTDTGEETILLLTIGTHDEVY